MGGEGKGSRSSPLPDSELERIGKNCSSSSSSVSDMGIVSIAALFRGAISAMSIGGALVVVVGILGSIAATASLKGLVSG